MVTLNVTKEGAEYLFYLLVRRELDGDVEAGPIATQILTKIQLPKKRG